MSYKIILITIEQRKEIRIVIYRRFKEILALRETLRQMYPGIYIPPVPSKTLINSTSEDFVERRRV